MGLGPLARPGLEALWQRCALRERVHGMPPADARKRLCLHAAGYGSQSRRDRNREQQRCRAAGEFALSAARMERDHDVFGSEESRNSYALWQRDRDAGGATAEG